MKPHSLFIGIFLFFTNDIYAQETCLPENTIITRQSQLDSFRILYPNCTHILGSVTLYGSDITDLSSLSSITTLSKDVSVFYTNITNTQGLKSIEKYRNISFSGNNTLESIELSDSITQCQTINIIDNSNLLKITGISLLDTLNGQFYVYNNKNLETIKVFEKLKYLDGQLFISGNNSLTQVDGFENISYVESLVLHSNVSMKTMIALHRLQEIKGYLQIGLHNVNSLNALKSLKRVGGTFLIGNCNALTSLSGFDSLNYVGKDFQIHSNQNLQEINSFNALSSANERLTIHANGKLERINGFKNLMNIKQIGINGNFSLERLDGFDNLQTIEDSLVIIHNRKIHDLSGFDKLEFTRKISIENEYALTDISKFFNKIDTGFLQFVRIKRCDSLSICNSPFLCTYLSDFNKKHEIESNNYGCSSREEILNTCISSVVENLPDKIITLYPNPTTGTITIQNIDTPMNITVYTIDGKRIKNLVITSNQINVESLPSGMYIIDIKNKHISERYKVVKVE